MHVSKDLYIEGNISAPIISQLAAQIDALTARLQALESGGGNPGGAPGRIQAENYDAGGEGIAYHDMSPGNEGGAYRSDDVDIKSSREGGYAVGWINAEEWLAYTVTIPASGVYKFTARVGSPLPDRYFEVQVDDGGTNSTRVVVAQTADWDQFSTVTIGNYQLSAGQHVVRFTMGAYDYMDFDWFEISAAR